MASSTPRSRKKTALNKSIKMKFEVEVHEVTVAISRTISAYVMLSVGRKARVASTSPAAVTKSDSGFSATWSKQDHLAMIVNMQPAKHDQQFDKKDFKFTLRHAIGEEKVMKTLASCKLDVSQLASNSKLQRLTLDMTPAGSLEDGIKSVKLDVSALCQPLQTVALQSETSTVTADDDLSDIEVSSDPHTIEVSDMPISLPSDSNQQLPKSTSSQINYKPRNSPQPVKRSAWNAAGRGSSSNKQREDGAFEFKGNYDPLGLLTVQLIGASYLALSTGCSPVGVYCVLTINGGLTTVRSPLCVYQPDSLSPIVWKQSQPLRFYANRSRHLFVLCRCGTELRSEANTEQYSNIVDMAETGQTAWTDQCVGAASQPLMSVNLGNCKLGEEISLKADIVESQERDQSNDVLIPLEPKGNVQINSRFFVLPYRHPVSARGRLTITNARDLLLEDSNSVSCFVRIDGKQQGSTKPVDTCGLLGWADEPVEFLLSNAVDVEIHLWSSKIAGAASWCAFGVFPLAACLYQKGSTRKPPRVESLDQCVTVHEYCECTSRLLLEPKGYLDIKLQLNPSQCPFLSIGDQAAASPRTTRKSLPHVGLSTEGRLQVVRTNYETSVGRPLQNLPEEMEEGVTDKGKLTWSDMLQLLKDRVELRQENDYLRESLTTIKTELAFSEFQQEKIAIENRQLKAQILAERQKTLSLAQKTTKMELREALTASMTDTPKIQ